MLDARLARLTQRQRDCLRLVAQGYTSKEIGRQLGISYSTVDNHLLAAVQSLEAATRAEAARMFMQHESGTGQQLPRHPPAIVDLPITSEQAMGPTQGWLGFIDWLVPPIGGRDNELDALRTLAAIGRIGLLAVLLFIATVMIVKMSFAALS